MLRAQVVSEYHSQPSGVFKISARFSHFHEERLLVLVSIFYIYIYFFINFFITIDERIYLNCLLQVDSDRVRYDNDDKRVLLSPKFLVLNNGMRVQLPWLWAGFDRSWRYRRAAEVKKQLDGRGMEVIVMVDRMRFMNLFLNFYYLFIVFTI